jgi:membrane protease YdiL (CAAX protease family)
VLATGGGVDPMERLEALIESPTVMLGIFFASMIINSLGLAICLFFSRTPLRDRLALHRGNMSAAGYVIFPLGALAVSTLCGLAITVLRLNSSTLESILKMVNDATPVELVFAFVLISLVGPIVEELIFRGYIQTRLVERHGALPGILISSAFFGLFHMDLVQGAFAFLLGLFLGTLTHRARSLYPAIVCHIAVNTLSTAATAAQVSDADHWVSLLVASGVVLPVSVVFLYRMRPAAAQAEPAPVPVMVERVSREGVPLE